MVINNVRSPSIPLTIKDLRAIADSRLSKQFSKRVLLVTIPTLVMAIAGAAFHKGSALDIGFVLIVVAMAGFVASLLAILRLYNKAEAEFVATHAGAFWVKSKEIK